MGEVFSGGIASPSKAMFLRGCFFLCFDFGKAVDLIRRSSENGCGEARLMLSRMYCYGVGVERSEEHANRLAKEAYSMRCPGAEIVLAAYSVGGIGVHSSRQVAEKILARSGLREVPWMLRSEAARFHAEGIYVPRDREEAERILARSMKAGDPFAALIWDELRNGIKLISAVDPLEEDEKLSADSLLRGEPVPGFVRRGAGPGLPSGAGYAEAAAALMRATDGRALEECTDLLRRGISEGEVECFMDWTETACNEEALEPFCFARQCGCAPHSLFLLAGRYLDLARKGVDPVTSRIFLGKAAGLLQRSAGAGYAASARLIEGTPPFRVGGTMMDIAEFLRPAGDESGLVWALDDSVLVRAGALAGSSDGEAASVQKESSADDEGGREPGKAEENEGVLRAELDSMRSRLDSAGEELERGRARIAALEADLAKASASAGDTEQVRRELAESKGRAAQSMLKAEADRQRIEVLERKLEESERAAKEAGSRLDTSESSRRNLEANLARMRDDLKAAEANREESWKSLVEARASIREGNERITGLQAELEQARSNAESTAEEGRRAAARLMELEAELQLLQEELKRSSSSAAGYAEEKRKLESTLRSLEERLGRMQYDLDAAVSDRDKARKDLAEAGESVKEGLGRIAGLEEALVLARGEAESAAEKGRGAESRAQKLEAELGVERKARGEDNARSAAEVRSLSADKEFLEGELERARAHAGSAKDSLNSELRRLRDELEHARKDSADAREQERKSASALRELDGKLREVSGELAEYERLADSLIEDRNELSGQLEAERQARSADDAGRASLQESLDAAMGRIRRLEAEAESLRSGNEKEIEEVRERFASKQAECEHLEHALDEEKKSRSDEKDAFAAEIRRKEHELASAVGRKDAEIAGLRSEMDAAEVRLAELEAEKKACAAEKARCAKLESEVRDLRKRRSCGNALIPWMLSAGLAACCVLCFFLRDDPHAAEGLRAQNDELSARVERLAGEEARFSAERSRLRDRVTELQGSLAEAEARVRRAESQGQEFSNDETLRKLHNEIKRLQEMNKKLNRRLAEM